MTKQKSKKLLRITGLKTEQPYADKGYENFARFSFMSSPSNGRKQCTVFQSCRDFLHEMYGTAINVSNTYPKDRIIQPIDQTKLRVLVQIGLGGKDPSDTNIEKAKQRVFSAKRAINLIEDKLDWPNSTITTVVHEYFKPVWLITGSVKWQNHPSMLSLFTLIVRFIAANGEVEAKTTKELFNQLQKMCCDEKHTKKDADLMIQCVDKLEELLSNYSGIIREDPALNYHLKFPGGFHYKGGIVSLCRFESSDEHANAAFKKICSKKK
jgi:hypothetical protein